MAKNCIGDFEFDDMPRTRGEWRELTERFTRHSIEAAQAKFTQEGGQDLADDCDYLLHELKIRQRQLDHAWEPLALGAFDRDMLARILACEAELAYTDCAYLGDEGDDDEVLDVEDGDFPFGLGTETCPAKEADIRGELIDAYMTYLYTAAAYAKSLGAEGAMRCYLRAWKLVHGPGINGSTGKEKRLSGANAIKAVNLEAVATDKLWVAVAARDLPPFTPKKA